MTGFSGMVSFEVKGGRQEATKFVEVREVTILMTLIITKPGH